MRLLNPDLINPYLETTPFYETFEKLLAKHRKMSDKLLDTRYQKQKDIFNDPLSDGLAMYDAEENAYAIAMIKVERNPDLIDLLIPKEEENILDIIAPDISAGNDYPKDSDMYRIFDREVSKLTEEDTNVLTTKLKKLNIEYTNGKEKKPAEQMNLIWDIKSIKTALHMIG